MNKVLIPTKLSDVAANTLKTAGYEVIQDADTPLEKQVAAHPDAVALIVRSEKVTPEIMDALPSLKLVVRAGAGYDNIDIVYARKKNVDVMNTPGANSNAVAEEVMAMILAYYRHIVQADATTREGLWEKKKYMGSELTKKTVGIIGLGNIGRNLVKRLQGFEPILLGYDHFLARQRALNIGVTPTSIEDIFSQCDIITLHVPGGPSTHHMVNAELIGKMKDGAVLINCSRYGVVDEEALAAAKAAGKNIANPIAQILSLALLLRYSLDADDAACAIERAINRALEEGIRTGDLARGAAAVSTDEMGDIIARYVAEGV